MEALRREIRITENCLRDCYLELEVWELFIGHWENTSRDIKEFTDIYDLKLRCAARFESELKKLQEILKFAEEKEERELAS